ncbi:MAG TPA: diacylglycerol kinase family protein [Pirellula sp.]|nr:diacylglycerol kinase family protein [Pirellula sp.]
MTALKKISLKDRLTSFGNAFRGIRNMCATQQNAWIHAIATLIVFSAGVVFRISNSEWCCLILCFMAVWTTEAMNTAVELVTDLASPEFHPLAGKAKDIAAGAVLIAAIGCMIVGAIVFVPYAWTMIIP